MTAVWCFAVGAALAVGLFFHTMGVLGILRFPDVYTRLHADTKATTFGSIFIALAAVLAALKPALAGEGGGAWTWVNLIVHIAFAVVVLLVTNATGGHAIARAAWRAGYRPAAAVVDRLGEPCGEPGEEPAGAEGPAAAAAAAAAAAEGPEDAGGPSALPEPEAPAVPEALPEPEAVAEGERKEAEG